MKTVQVDLTDEYYDQIHAFAEIDRRSLSEQIVYFLTGHVEFSDRRWDEEEQRGVPTHSDVRYPYSQELEDVREEESAS